MGDEPHLKTVLVVDDHQVVALSTGLALQASKELSLADVVTDPMDPNGTIKALAPDALVFGLAFSGSVDFR